MGVLAIMRYLRCRLLAWAVVVVLTLSACVPRENGPVRSLTDRIPGSATGVPSAPIDPQITSKLGQLPLYFVENRGQVDPRVGYYAQAHGATTFFTSGGLTYSLVPGRQPGAGDGADGGDTNPSGRWVVRADFLGGDPAARPMGQEQTDAIFSYFRGQPDEWVTGVPAYRGVTYADVWPGIDVVYGAHEGHLKYDLVVRPGADPARIAVAYRGARAVRLTEAGDIAIQTGLGDIVERAPYAYQDVAGQRVEVPSAFNLEADPELGHEVVTYRLGAYDPALPLIIDPAVIVYAGYIGGDANDEGTSIAVDTAGNVYIAGQTNQATAVLFPQVVGPDLSFNGGSDAFVAKVRADGTSLVYAGYIGGSQGDGGGTNDGGTGIAVGADGSAYVTGRAQSSKAQGFPVTTGAFDEVIAGKDAFVAKVNPGGTALTYATYIGGNNSEEGIAIAVDSAGNAYVAGVTDSAAAAAFPVTGTPAQPNIGGLEDAFVAKLNPTGSALVYAGYIGGINNDKARGIAVDGAGNAYVAGTTASSEATFPDTVGPTTTFRGVSDAFVAKVSPNGQAFVYAGFIGGAAADEGLDVDVSPTCTIACEAYVVGKATAPVTNFPVLVGPNLVHNGGEDAFVAKVKGDGTGLVFAGFIGGTQNDAAYDVALDGAGGVYVTGSTSSNPTTQLFPRFNAPSLNYGGGQDAFIAKVKPDGTTLSYAGYVGGDQADIAFGVAADAAGNAYIAGFTFSSQATFPDLIGPSTAFVGAAGQGDTFVAKIGSTTDVAITMTDSPDPATVAQPLTYNMTVSNAGPLPATNVTVTDTLQAGLDYVSAAPNQGTCTFAAPTVTCALGTIPVGSTAIVSLVVTPTVAGTYTNTATVTRAEDDLNPANDTATQTTIAVAAGTPSLCIPRPKVEVSVTNDGPGKIRAVVRSTSPLPGNELRQIRFNQGVNAVITAGGQTGGGNLTVPFPAGTVEFVFTVNRVASNQATTVPMVVTDVCGDWPTFVGMGVGVP